MTKYLLQYFLLVKKKTQPQSPEVWQCHHLYRQYITWLTDSSQICEKGFIMIWVRILTLLSISLTILTSFLFLYLNLLFFLFWKKYFMASFSYGIPVSRVEHNSCVVFAKDNFIARVLAQSSIIQWSYTI